jgi:hypothetical protein
MENLKPNNTLAHFLDISNDSGANKGKPLPLAQQPAVVGSVQKRKVSPPSRSISRRNTRLGTGPPGTIFKFTLNGQVAVTRDYSEYFNYRTLLFEALRGKIKILSNDRAQNVIRKRDSTQYSRLGRRSEANNTENGPSSSLANHRFTVQNQHNSQSNISKGPQPQKAVLLSARRMSANGATCLRSCTSCGASKTPYWRDGWGSEVVLCNACGLRYQKFKKFCLSCKYIPRKEEQQSDQCSQCCHSWR